MDKIAKEPKGREYYEALFSGSKEYQRHYRESIYFALWRRLMEFIRQVPSPKILEIGCGTGQFAHYLFDEGFRDYRGFDLSPTGVGLAQKRVALPFQVGDALDGTSYRGDYNLAVCLEVLEHLSGDLAMLRLLNPGVAIVFSLPTFDDPAHVRFFRNESEIAKRYQGYIDIRQIVRVASWFACRGTVSAHNPR